MLTLRRAGLSSAAYRDSLDYVIVDDGREAGRLYEDRHSKPELRWFWSITVYVDPKRGITTNGRAATIEAAKAQFLTNSNFAALATRYHYRTVLRREGQRVLRPKRVTRQSPDDRWHLSL